jgi:DNA invertase Pin-like site-specific DNA recombinase
MGHDMTTTEPRDTKTPRAYSYVRFSTPEQAKGHSRDRQTERAKAWAEKRGVTLDAELSFEDHGVSGFTGANVEAGKLGHFLECVRTGAVPRGSWLIVESLGRQTRRDLHLHVDGSRLDALKGDGGNALDHSAPSGNRR